MTRQHGLEAFADCGASQVAGGNAAIGGPFTLIDEDGATVTDRDVLAKPAFVYFGFAHCTDVCPTDMARNAQAVDILEEQGFEVTPVFISVDPERDTPAVLKEWTDYLHPRMLGLTGTPDQIKAVAAAYKTYYQIPDHAPGEDYEVGHMTQTYLMFPKVGFATFFTSDQSADDVAQNTACFLDAAKSLS